MTTFAEAMGEFRCGAHLWLPLPDGGGAEGYCAEYLPHPPGEHVPRMIDLMKWRSLFKTDAEFQEWLTKLAEGGDS